MAIVVVVPPTTNAVAVAVARLDAAYPVVGTYDAVDVWTVYPEAPLRDVEELVDSAACPPGSDSGSVRPPQAAQDATQSALTESARIVDLRCIATSAAPSADGGANTSPSLGRRPALFFAVLDRMAERSESRRFSPDQGPTGSTDPARVDMRSHRNVTVARPAFH
jgi:hypothetical protein